MKFKLILLMFFLIFFQGLSCADIYTANFPSNPDSDFTIKLSTNKKTYFQNDTISIFFEVTKPCYITIVNKSVSGQESILFPFDKSSVSKKVHIGRTYTVPDEKSLLQFSINGPQGAESIIAYATLKENTLGKQLCFLEESPSLPRVLPPNAFSQIILKDLDYQQRGWAVSETVFNVKGEPDIFMVAIGANTYKLKGCEKDAVDFSNTMKSHLKIPDSNTLLLTNSDANKRGIEQAFSQIKHKMKFSDNSLFILYLSMHGSSIEDDGNDEYDGYDEVLLPYDCNPLKPETLIRDDELRQWLNNINAKRTIVVADSCFSGTITKDILAVSKFYSGGALRRPKINLPRDNFINEFGNIMLLAASKESQGAMEKNGRGLFSFEFCNAINRGAKNIEEAFQLARKQVLERSGNQQEPVLIRPENTFCNISFKKQNL